MKNKLVAFTRRTLAALARRAPLSRDLFRALDASEQARIAAVTELNNLEKAAPPAAAPSSPLPIPKFWEKNYWEPTVQFPIRDYCRPGDVVFDVARATVVADRKLDSRFPVIFFPELRNRQR